MKRAQGDRVASILMVLPSIILVAVFVYGFIGRTLWVSMTDWGQERALALDRQLSFVGLANYRNLFTEIVETRFRQDIVNVVFYSLTLVGGAIAIGLFLAILLDRDPKGKGAYRTVFLYPMSLSFIVTGTIWRWMLAPSGGVNLLPTLIGLPRMQFKWLSSRGSILQFNWQNALHILAVVVALAVFYFAWRTYRRGKTRVGVGLAIAGLLMALWGLVGWPRVQVLPFEESHGFKLATIGVIIAAIWQYSGYTMAIFVAGLGGIPQTVHDSAKIDGISETGYYLRVAIPMLKSTTLSAIIILSHISLKLFALIFAMAGPDNAETGHLAVLMYLTTFRANNFAKGAAVAVILFVIGSLFIIPYLVSSHRERRV